MSKNKDTIFALGTPTGKSAIAVFRISGKNTAKLAKKILLRPELNHKRAFISYVISPEGQKIDNTISTFFKGPKSYKGSQGYDPSVRPRTAVFKEDVENIIEETSWRRHPGGLWGLGWPCQGLPGDLAGQGRSGARKC